MTEFKPPWASTHRRCRVKGRLGPKAPWEIVYTNDACEAEALASGFEARGLSTRIEVNATIPRPRDWSLAEVFWGAKEGS